MPIRKDPIEGMPAGPVMDRLIAEKVMNYKTWAFGVPRYSESIEVAWTVIEKLKENGCQVVLKVHKAPFLYWCQIYRAKHPDWRDPNVPAEKRRRRYGEDDFKVWASYVETMPLAICRAALRLVERSGSR